MKIVDTNIKLIENLNNGNISVFEQLFKQYHKPLYFYAFNFLQLEEESKDVIQDVFLKFWKTKAYSKIDNEKALKSYLFRSVKNAIINKFNKKNILTLSIDLLSHEIFQEEFEKYDEKLIYDIKKEIENLPKQVKQVVMYIFFNKMRYQETADEMGISVNTVKSYLKTGVSHLRQKFAHKVDVFLFIV